MKKINKIFSVFLAIIMVISALPICASATDVAYSVSSVTGKTGDTVSVSVSLSTSIDLWGSNVQLKYNSAELQVVEYTTGGAVSNGSINDSGTSVNFSGMFAAKSGTVFTVRFKILKESGEASLILSSSENTDVNGNNHDFSAINGIVTIIEDCAVCTITPNKTDIKAGDTFEVYASISDNSNINALTVDVVYDSSKLEYVSYELHTTGGNKVVNPSYSEGKFRYVYADETSSIVGGVFLSVQFKALESSCSIISLDIIESIDKDFNTIKTITVPTKIHSFGDWTTEANPTCENAGQKSKSCTCGAKVTESISALGHDYSTEYTVDKNATCTVNGSKSQHCSRCESVQNITVIPATGHSYKEEITKVPTHTENGEKTFTCSNCGDSYKEVINADGTHKHISAVTKEPTCTEKGVMTYTCACGDKYTEEIPMVAHTETTVSAVAPTCTQTGLTEGKKCSVCGEILTAQQEIPATGHVPNSKGNCDTCGEKICDHNCHKGGISGFFWKISNFFNKLFGSKKYCECGYAHY